MNKEAHIGVGVASINLSRWKVVDYTYLVYLLDYKFMTATPKPIPDYFNIIEPFTLGTWSAILVSLMIVTIFTVIVEQHFSKNEKKIPSDVPLHILASQQSTIISCNGSTAVLIGTWMLVSAVLTYCYKSDLLGSLLAPKYEKPIDYASDVVNLGIPIKLGKGSFVKRVMQTSPRESMRNVKHGEQWSFQKPEERVETYNMVQAKKAVSIASSVTTLQKDYDVRLSKETVYLSKCAYLTQKGNRWLPFIDKIIQSLVEAGMKEKYLNDANLAGGILQVKRATAKINKNKAMTTTHLIASFIVYIVGILLSIAKFLMEKLH